MVKESKESTYRRCLLDPVYILRSKNIIKSKIYLFCFLLDVPRTCALSVLGLFVFGIIETRND